MIVKWSRLRKAFIDYDCVGHAVKVDRHTWRFAPNMQAWDMLDMKDPVDFGSFRDLKDYVQRRATEYASPR